MVCTICINKTVLDFLDVIPFLLLDLAIFVVLQLNYFSFWLTIIFAGMMEMISIRTVQLQLPTLLHHRNQGTIHILRQQLYITKLNLSTQSFIKTGLFRQNKRVYFSTLYFDEIFMLKYLVLKEEKKSWKCCGWYKSAYVIHECPLGPRKMITFSQVKRLFKD